MKLTYQKIKNVVEKKGYKFFTGDLNVNLIGVRSLDDTLDEWNDTFILAYEENGKQNLLVITEFTTDPGKYYLKDKLLNENGCAILKEGQYRGVYKIGYHGTKPYKALIQTGNSVKVFRDRNRDNHLDFNESSVQEGWFGINLHHGYSSEKVTWNSAGCQVFRHKKDLDKVLNIVEKSSKLYGDKFTYTLLNERDFE